MKLAGMEVMAKGQKTPPGKTVSPYSKARFPTPADDDVEYQRPVGLSAAGCRLNKAIVAR